MAEEVVYVHGLWMSGGESLLLRRRLSREFGMEVHPFRYAAAAERARIEDWPDEAYKNWRYQRASLARLLANEGMMRDVADAYADVRKQNAPRRSLRDRLISLVRMDEP